MSAAGSVSYVEGLRRATTPGPGCGYTNSLESKLLLPSCCGAAGGGQSLRRKTYACSPVEPMGDRPLKGGAVAITPVPIRESLEVLLEAWMFTHGLPLDCEILHRSHGNCAGSATVLGQERVDDGLTKLQEPPKLTVTHPAPWLWCRSRVKHFKTVVSESPSRDHGLSR